MAPEVVMKHSPRVRMWRSIRIFRRFTAPDLCRTAQTSVRCARYFIQNLSRHGYIAACGGRNTRANTHQSYRLVNDCGPLYPKQCSTCGRGLYDKCIPKPEKTGGREQAWELLLSNPEGLTAIQISILTGMSYNSVRRFFIELRTHGLIRSACRTGRAKKWTAARNIPHYPKYCPQCGRTLVHPCTNKRKNNK